MSDRLEHWHRTTRGELVQWWAERVPPRDTGEAAHTASLASWLLFLPGQSPAWSYYALAAIHLRPIEGAKPAHLDFPGAEHEIMLLALDPRSCPSDLRGANYLDVRPQFLTPINVREQLAGSTDADVIKLIGAIARGLVIYALPAEPEGIRGARELWRRTIFHTLEHIQTGGHHHAPAGEA